MQFSQEEVVSDTYMYIELLEQDYF